MLQQLQTHTTNINNFLNKLQGPNFKEKSIKLDLNYLSENNRSILKIHAWTSEYEIFIWNERSRIKSEIAKYDRGITSHRMKPELLLKDMRKYAPDLYKIMGW